MELLSPAGNMERLETAFYFGADAVYLSGRAFGLRAYAGNFDDAQLEQAVLYAHGLGKKAYIAANIFLREQDIPAFKDYIALLGAHSGGRSYYFRFMRGRACKGNLS